MSQLRSVGALALVAAALLVLPAAAPAAEPSLYVSLGDSYATGYQATGVRQGRNTRNGFAYLLPAKVRKAGGPRLKLVNFACGGATTVSLLNQREPCSPRGRGPDGRTWGGRTQMAAAERYLRQHRGDVRLITVSIGGNDVTSCARAADTVACTGTAVQRIKRNVTRIAKRLHAAAPDAQIVGITYPDVILGQWVGENPNQELAKLSVVAFQALINPALKSAYESAGGQFVDVTAASGSYTPLDQLVEFPPYGQVPRAVAEVCRLTFMCAFGDIHPRTAGYELIADLITRVVAPSVRPPAERD